MSNYYNFWSKLIESMTKWELKLAVHKMPFCGALLFQSAIFFGHFSVKFDPFSSNAATKNLIVVRITLMTWWLPPSLTSWLIRMAIFTAIARATTAVRWAFRATIVVSWSLLAIFLIVTLLVMGLFVLLFCVLLFLFWSLLRLGFFLTAFLLHSKHSESI